MNRLIWLLFYLCRKWYIYYRLCFIARPHYYLIILLINIILRKKTKNPYFYFILLMIIQPLVKYTSKNKQSKFNELFKWFYKEDKILHNLKISLKEKYIWIRLDNPLRPYLLWRKRFLKFSRMLKDWNKVIVGHSCNNKFHSSSFKMLKILNRNIKCNKSLVKDVME